MKFGKANLSRLMVPLIPGATAVAFVRPQTATRTSTPPVGQRLVANQQLDKRVSILNISYPGITAVRRTP